jgi:hypothetical protein
MKTNKTYRNLIDLAFFFHLDKGVDEDQLHGRDRSIYLENPNSEKDKNEELLHFWLNRRRENIFSGRAGKSPGTTLHDSLKLLSTVLLIIGFVIGLSAGLSFFSYSGTTPVNVFHFLFIFVFSQLALVMVLLISVMLRLSGRHQLPSGIVQLYGTLITFFTTRIARQVVEKLSAESRYGYEQALGLIKKNRSLYGSLLYWPLFTLSQMVMVALNIGLLAATLFRIITSDIAFGWQSTIQFTTQAIHKGMQILATPWEWLIPGQGYPTLAEIEGSRIILKDGMYHLATQDLISWWPFLVLCLLVYGFFLRFLLVLGGSYLQHRSLQNFSFNSPESLRVIQRMSTPVLSTRATRGDPPPPSAPGTNDGAEQNPPRPHAPGHPLTLLIPADISNTGQPDEISSLLSQQGFSISGYEIILQDYDSDQTFLEKLSRSGGRDNSGLLVIFEAWMVPINDSLLFLKQLREAVGTHTPIYIGLLGRNPDASILAPPTRQERKIWQQKLDGLGDPFLSVLEFNL